MKKIILIMALGIIFMTAPVSAAPSGHHGGGHAGMGRPPISGGMHRPPMGSVHRPPMSGMHRPPAGAVHRPPVVHHRPLRPVYRPIPFVYRPYLYSSFYYPSSYYTTYTYYPVTTEYMEETTPAQTEVKGVIVKDNYAGINTALNIINTAANVTATLKLLSW